MSRSRCLGLVAAVGFAACCSLVLLTGCSEKAGGEHDPNNPPDTHVSFGPKENEQTYYKVQIFWYGTDLDGTVDRYQLATVSGIGADSLANLNFDDLPFITTSATESTFVLTADSCCSTSGTAQLALSYWGVLVRAVDNEGAVDPDPEPLFFQASNVVPKLRITVPRKVYGPFQGVGRNPYFEWLGEDADGDVGSMMYKYIVAPVKKTDYPSGPPDLPPVLPPFDQVYTGSKLPGAAPPIGYWSDWVSADCTYVRDINLSPIAAMSGYFARVCITCKDEGGAILPQELFDQTYNASNNWEMLSIIETSGGVKTVIDGGPLGRRDSNDRANYITNVAGLFSGAAVSFKFWGDEQRSQGSLVREFRYYYDDPEDPRTSSWNYWTSTEPIRDRSNNPEWLVRYPADGKQFVPPLGPHIFAVELRDLNGQITHAEFRLEVLQGPRGKAEKLVYLVDDDVASWLPRYDWQEQGSDSLWRAILEPYSSEVFDTGNTGKTPYTLDVPIRRIADASTVIWFEDLNPSAPNTQLTKVCYERGNYLNSYVKVGGNLIIIGRDPIYSCQAWPTDGRLEENARGDVTTLDFTPRFNRVDSTYTFNFNWDIFGIVRMAIAVPDVPTNELSPCEPGYPAIPTIKEIPDYNGWQGLMTNTFYITETRTTTDEKFPMEVPVQKLYTIVPCDESGNPVGPPDCAGRLIGVCVPAHGDRGFAAYIGMPPWYFDHDQVKVLIQQLLDEFGEPRKAP